MYDFVHLPLNPTRRANLGYFFVNFSRAEFVEDCKRVIAGKPLGSSATDKRCEVCPAKLQGRAELAKQAQKALELRNDALLVEQKAVETLEKELSIAPPPSVPPQLEQEVEVLRTFLREGLAQDSPDWTGAAKKVQEKIGQITADAEEPIRKKQKPEGTADAAPAS